MTSRLSRLGPVRVLSVVGNRPQFIKSAPLSVALRAAGIREVVLHTGQHYDRELSQVFFDELSLGDADYLLDVRTRDVDAMVPGIAAALEETRPDWTLVYGDTNSTLAGARAATVAGVPIAHVEAGLRSGDLSMPEERNRIEVDRLSALLLCPDERSAATLRAEGVEGRIEVVGDVMDDACLQLAPAARERSTVLDGLRPRTRRLCASRRCTATRTSARAARPDPRRPVPDRRAGRVPGPSAHGRKRSGPRA